VYPLWWSRGLTWLNALAPGVCDRLVVRFGRRQYDGSRRS
jgi:hypothetical protein